MILSPMIQKLQNKWSIFLKIRDGWIMTTQLITRQIRYTQGKRIIYVGKVGQSSIAEGERHTHICQFVVERQQIGMGGDGEAAVGQRAEKRQKEL